MKTSLLNFLAVYFFFFVDVSKCGKINFSFCAYDDSEIFRVDSIESPNCPEPHACTIKPFVPMKVTITGTNKRTIREIPNIKMSAGIQQYGFIWDSKIEPVNPCPQWKCHIYDYRRRSYTGYITVNIDALRRPSKIILKATYQESGFKATPLCLVFPVNVV